MIDTICVTLLIIAVIAVGTWVKINRISKKTDAFTRQMEDAKKLLRKKNVKGEKG